MTIARDLFVVVVVVMLWNIIKIIVPTKIKKGNKMKTQEELDDMSMIELVEEFIATCDRVIERNNSGNAV
jgi:hypothetical protein